METSGNSPASGGGVHAKTVFICSTLEDLGHERQSILDAIRRLELRHDAMEFFGARTRRPLETCLEEVRKSDILVVVIGHLYGSIAEEVGVSYSEAEYLEGRRLRKPCLVYLKDENIPVFPRDMERDPTKIQLLDAWKKRLLEEHTIARYKDGQDLVVQVVADLTRSVRDLERADEELRRTSEALSPNALSSEIDRMVRSVMRLGVARATILAVVSDSLRALTSRRTGRPDSVFISYQEQDVELAHRIERRLSRSGFKPWLDQWRAPNVKPGSNYELALHQARIGADFVVVILSPSATELTVSNSEVIAAITKNAETGSPRIIPLLVGDDIDVPPLLRQYRSILWQPDNREVGMLALVEELRSNE